MAKMGCAKCGKMMKSGGTKKMAKGGSTLSGSAIKKAPVQLYGIPQSNMGTSGQYGQMKNGGAKKYAKGGTTDSRYNRPVEPGCHGGYVKDANGKCVPERTAKKGGSMKDLSGDGKITKKDVLIGRGVIAKKAQGGPIFGKLKAKVAERKVTNAIKKSVKNSGKIIK